MTHYYSSYTTNSKSYAGNYRFDFNGMEKDNEVKGIGNSLDFGARIYDSRLGRWLSLDPAQKEYPQASPYNFVLNSPTNYVDKDGKRVFIIVYGSDKDLMVAALTRAREIQAGVEFDTKKDHVYMLPLADLGDLKKQVLSIVNDANKNNYGKTVELDIYSHVGDMDGPIGEDMKNKSISLEDINEDPFSVGQMSPKGWRSIGFNFDPENSITTFHGCNSTNFAQKFLDLQPKLKYSAGSETKVSGSYSLQFYDKTYFPSLSNNVYMLPISTDNNTGKYEYFPLSIFQKGKKVEGTPYYINMNSQIQANPYLDTKGNLLGKAANKDGKTVNVRAKKAVKKKTSTKKKKKQ